MASGLFQVFHVLGKYAHRVVYYYYDQYENNMVTLQLCVNLIQPLVLCGNLIFM